MNVDRFVQCLEAHARSQGSSGTCARHVRDVLRDAGFDIKGHPAFAKDWGPTLARLGFAALTDIGYEPVRGDIVVFRPVFGAPFGHIQAFDGKHWVSDHVQTNGFWPGPQYTKPVAARFMPYRLGEADIPVVRWPSDRRMPAAMGPFAARPARV